MITILRLGSVVRHGVGGPEAGSMDLIYTFLLKEFEQDVYSYIGINQIDDELEELIMKESGNRIFVNIRYPIYKDFENKSVGEKNKIRLDVIHTALSRIAEYENKLSLKKLEKIRDEILKKDFLFDFVYKTCISKKTNSRVAKIVVRPEMKQFKISILIEEKGKEKCNVPIFMGIPNSSYMDKYFFYGKWNDSKFIVWGKDKTVETHISVDTCKIDIVNLTPYDNPPYYTMMKVGLTNEEKEKATKDWHHSMSPTHAAIIRQHLGGASN